MSDDPGNIKFGEPGWTRALLDACKILDKIGLKDEDLLQLAPFPKNIVYLFHLLTMSEEQIAAERKYIARMKSQKGRK